MNEYFIGQRVLIDNVEIVTVVRPPKYIDKSNIDKANLEIYRIWVRDQDGIVYWKAVENVKPLPNGQL